MLTNLNQVSKVKNQFSGFNVAIVGAGAAGIVLALKLAEYGKKVALIEAGGNEYSEESQQLYLGKTVGDAYFQLDHSRLRYFGGSTNHWTGWCRTFEPEDFNRGYLGNEYKWPIEYEELDRFRVEACDILEISRQTNKNDKRYTSPRIESFKFAWSGGINNSPPVKFQSKYYESLIKKPRVHVFLNSNLVDVGGENSFNRLNYAKVLSYNGNEAIIKAENFVFAMGGIENSRYLLWLQAKYGEKFISKSVPLGRYWMEHPHFTLGEALVDRSKVSELFYSLSPKAQFDNQILNCGFRIEHLNKAGTRKLMHHVACLAPKLGKQLYSLADRNLVCGSKLRAVWEQAPHYENRVLLDSETDRFGIPKPILNWKKRALDRRTIIKSVSEFNDWFLQIDAGRIKLNEWILDNKDYPDDDELAGHHHMGGTRMHEDQRLGVVNSNLKVYGLENLFIAGSSVFTTAGHNNPTLPIVQFSLRLAEYLNK